MRRLWIVAAIVLATGCGSSAAPVAWEQLAGSEAVMVLATPATPDRVIYHPPVDLAKKPS